MQAQNYIASGINPMQPNRMAPNMFAQNQYAGPASKQQSIPSQQSNVTVYVGNLPKTVIIISATEN